ncbi:MAG: hypothetical protein HY865_04665 [Chloroflexi bacterium]|nr:hypothetical protein [Chloroflexota bacterium]
MRTNLLTGLSIVAILLAGCQSATPTPVPISAPSETPSQTEAPAPSSTAAPVSVTFENVCDFERTQVTLEGYISTCPGNNGQVCAVSELQSSYMLNFYSRPDVHNDYKSMYALIPIGEDKNEMRPLKDNYSYVDVRMTSDDGTWVGNGDFVALTGTVLKLDKLALDVSCMLKVVKITKATLDKTVTPTPAASVTGERHVESEGGFSYLPPSDWQIVEFPGMKYKGAWGKETAGFSPSLKFHSETYAGPLDDYISDNLELIKRVFSDVMIISQENFKTNDGENAIKVIAEDTQAEQRLHQIFYYLAAGDEKFIITYTRLAEAGEENDILVDESIKTFQFDN